MKILQTKHKWHIRFRIFLLLFALLAVVFFSVFFSFNLFLKSYIRTSSQTQLIAGTVTGPVRKLSKFAENLGKGDFNPQHFDFKDIEFEELADAMNRSAEKLSAYDKDQRTFFRMSPMNCERR